MNLFPDLGTGRAMSHVAHPLETPLNNQQELSKLNWLADHPGYLSEPTRDRQGNLIPASLYDFNAEFYTKPHETINSMDHKVHFTDLNKLPGFHEYDPESGDSYFSTYSKLAPRFPQYAGQWQGQGDVGHYVPPAKQMDIEQFYKGLY